MESWHYDFNNDLESVTDEQLINLVKEDSNVEALEFLISKYRNVVKMKARTYFLVGAEREDIIQEGMIGLYKAIRDFREDKQSSFRSFADLCITRQIITAVKTATRQKHIPLNSYVSLHRPVYSEDSDRTLMDTVAAARTSDPVELIIGSEDFAVIEEKMGKLLSELEWQVLMMYLDGKSYCEIAEVLDRHIKSIDNALQRVKRKMEYCFEGRKCVVPFISLFGGLSVMHRGENLNSMSEALSS